MRRALLLLALGCAACAEPRRAPSLPREAIGSRIDVFLRSVGGETDAVGFHLTRVCLRDAAGDEIELDLRTPDVVSTEARRLVAIAGGPVEPGAYEMLVLGVDSATQERAGTVGALELSSAPPESAEPAAPEARTIDFEVPRRIVVGRHDAVSIFLSWDAGASVDAGSFRPRFGVDLEKPQVRLGLLYVADAGTGSVLAVDRSTGQVVATGKVGRRPSALAASNDRQLLLVANAGDGSLGLVDVRRDLTQFTIPVGLGARTSDVVAIDGGRLAAVTNPGIDSVSLFDVRTASRMADLRVGRTPIRLEFVADQGRLFVANSLSDDLSVIDVRTRVVIATLPVESTPTYVVADRRGREVFVGHRTSPNLLVIDADQLVVVTSILAGADVTALLADRRRDRIYVARSRPPEIVVVDRRLEAVTRRIPISGRVESLAQPAEGSMIYGAAPELGGLVVINVILGREEPLLPCGTAPTDVVAID